MVDFVLEFIKTPLGWAILTVVKALALLVPLLYTRPFRTLAFFVPALLVPVAAFFACNYAAGRPGARQFRGHVANVGTREEFLAVVDQYFPRT